MNVIENFSVLWSEDRMVCLTPGVKESQMPNTSLTSVKTDGPGATHGKVTHTSALNGRACIGFISAFISCVLLLCPCRKHHRYPKEAQRKEVPSSLQLHRVRDAVTDVDVVLNSMPFVITTVQAILLKSSFVCLE